MMYFYFFYIALVLRCFLANLISDSPKLSIILLVPADSTGVYNLNESIYQVDKAVVLSKDTHLRKADGVSKVEIYFIDEGSLSLEKVNFSLKNVSLKFEKRTGSIFLFTESIVLMEEVQMERQNISSKNLTIISIWSSTFNLKRAIFSDLEYSSEVEGSLISIYNSIMVIDEGNFRNGAFIKNIFILLSNSSLKILNSEISNFTVLGNDRGWIQSTNGIVIRNTSIIRYNSNRNFLSIEPSITDAAYASFPLIVEKCHFSYILINSSITNDAFLQTNYLFNSMIMIISSTFETISTTQILFKFVGPNFASFFGNYFISNCYSVELISIQLSIQISFIGNAFIFNNNKNICLLPKLGTLIGLTSCINSNLVMNKFESSLSTENVAVLKISINDQNEFEIAPYVHIYECSFSENIVDYTKMDFPGVSLSVISSQITALVVVNCLFENNYMNPSFPKERIGGPCIYSSSKYLQAIIYGSIFKKNKSKFDSACVQIELGDRLVVTKSAFYENTAPNGAWQFYYKGTAGGIHTSTQEILVLGCSFKNNSNYKGTGLYIDGSRVAFQTSFLVAQCEFENNKANHGGGILLGQLLVDLKLALILGSLFRNNVAEFGGGISVRFDISNAMVVIMGCEFISNHAEFGGGIAFQQPSGRGEVYLSRFFQNLGKFISDDSIMTDIGGGGALTIYGRSQTEVSSYFCIFEMNKASFSGSIFFISFTSRS